MIILNNQYINSSKDEFLLAGVKLCFYVIILFIFAEHISNYEKISTMRSINIIVFLLWSILSIGQSNNTLFTDYSPFVSYEGHITDGVRGSQLRDIDPLLKDKLEQVVDDYFNEKGMVGVSVAMNFEEDEIWAYANGKSKVDVPLTTEHSMAVGSISKSITAATILKLVDESVITLDDTIGQWVSDPDIDPAITIRQCLNHTSGIYNYSDNLALGAQIFFDMSRIWKPIEVIDLLVKEKKFEKGTDWSYSNTNYIVLGIIIESVTGQDYHDVVRSKILSPAGLDNVQLYAYETFNTELADLWFSISGGNTTNATKQYGNLNALFSAAWAAGAYISTPSDITKWMKSLFKGDILSQDRIDDMLDGYDFDNGDSYGLGIGIRNVDGVEAYGHNGEILYSSAMLFIPSMDLSIAVSTNDGSVVGDGIDKLLVRLLDAYILYETNVEDIVSIEGLNIVPNPTNNILNIEIKSSTVNTLDIKIIDALGKVVLEVPTERLYEGNNRLSYDIRQITSGSYYVVMEVEGERSVRKITVIK